VNIHGLLSACRYCQSGHSNSCSDFALRWHLAETDEKVSPTRNNNAHSRCASHCNDIGLDDTVLQQLIQLSYFNKSRRNDYSDNLSSRIHGNCSSYPWHLASCFLASASRYKDLFREKERHARYNNTLANSTGPWHHSVPENHSAILIGNLQYSKALFLFLSKVEHQSNRYWFKNGKFRSGLFQAL
jgi:hypothetical protein